MFSSQCHCLLRGDGLTNPLLGNVLEGRMAVLTDKRQRRRKEMGMMNLS